jgi:hypothetical protein
MGGYVDVVLRCLVAGEMNPDELKRGLEVQVGCDSAESVILAHEVSRVEHVSALSRDLEIPVDLSTVGLFAATAIYKLLEEDEALYTGGCKVFYSPQEWRRRQEDYGSDSELIVCHDGGGHAPYFNPDYGCYTQMERMRVVLERIGAYVEQCTCWYSAVYKV